MNLSTTIIKLLNGNTDILEHYQNANSLWEKIWNDDHSTDTEKLSRLLSSNQFKFENQCGGEHSGKEIMPWSGFAYLLEPNGDLEAFEKAERLKEAFANSYCSIEIKNGAREAARHFGLEDS